MHASTTSRQPVYAQTPPRFTGGGTTEQERFRPFAEKMRQAQMPEAAIRVFQSYYQQLLQGATGYLARHQVQPVSDLPSAADFGSLCSAGLAALPRTVVIKLNGGLGTTMGMQGPKSLIQVKENLTFLDIIVRQVLSLREQHNVALPLIFMNSFHTEAPTQRALTAYPLLRQKVPFSFLQHQIPKIWQADLTPAEWSADRKKEWCPPGHGDLYLALQTSGLLEKLLAKDYEYAFISNADNLGATLDPAILGYFATEQLPFLLEAARRQPADRKGGHLGYQPGRGLILREVAQCPADELEEFQNIQRYCYFNTNNLWLHLPTLKQLLERTQGVLGLPLIRNEKPIDPTQPESRRVYQLETAMGHAISVFPQAQAVEVNRARFLPVKTTNDLLALWSDAYVLNPDYTISLHPARQDKADLVIDLDKSYYGHFHQLKARFPRFVPSLVNCHQFRVRGNVYFDAAIGLEGDVSIQGFGDTPVRWGSMVLTPSELTLSEQ
jgi:UTP--glucose-1-phosphate uridylyltransferase